MIQPVRNSDEMSLTDQVNRPPAAVDAEQELLSARSDLVSAQRDEYVAGFAVLADFTRASGERCQRDHHDADRDQGNARHPVQQVARRICG